MEKRRVADEGNLPQPVKTMLSCAISISTHNREHELAETCRVLQQLSPPPDEVLICADGCTDSTVDFVRKNFPAARLIVHEKSRGSITSRDELIRAAQSDIVVSLDDDSHPIEPDFITRVRKLFADMPRLAVASFPQRSDEFPETLTQSDFGASYFAGNYVNAAAAFRRSAYLELDGWETRFQHAYDESDYSLQCLAAGWQVFHFTGATIRHRYSGVNRNEISIHHRQARNEQWSLWKRCPFPFVLAVSLFRAAREFGYAARRGLSWLVREPRWWAQCATGLPAVLADRKPVPWPIYFNWMKLVRQPIFSESEWAERFGKSEK